MACNRKIKLHHENISNIVCMHKAGMSDDSVVAHISAEQIAEQMRRRIARLEWQLGDMQQVIDRNKVNYNLDNIEFV